MSRSGQLIDVSNGIRLVQVAVHGITHFKIGKVRIELSIQAGTQCLKFAKLTTSGNKSARHQEAVSVIVNELEKRTKDLEVIEIESLNLHREIVEEGDVDGSRCLEITHMLMVMSQHWARIKELQALTSLSVEFEEETVEESVLLTPFTAVEICEVMDGRLVMWLPPPGQDVSRVLLKETRREAADEKNEEMSTVVHRIVEGWDRPLTLKKGIAAWDCCMGTSASAPCVLLSDQLTNHVYVVSLEGELIRSFGFGAEPQEEPHQYQLYGPAGLATVDGDDQVFVAETWNTCVSLWNVSSGSYIRSFGSSGSGPGQLLNPYGISVNTNHVVVADCGNHRVQVFNHEGGFIREMGMKGNDSRLGQLNEPREVAVGNDTVAVWCQQERRRVSLFSEVDGSFLRCFEIERERAESDCSVERMAIRNGMLHLILWSVSADCFQIKAFTLTGTLVRQCNDMGDGEVALDSAVEGMAGMVSFRD